MRPEDFPISVAQCEWFYRRSGTIMRSPYMLNAGWMDPALKGNYLVPNLVAEAGKDLGFADDRLRLALASAAVREGRKVGNLDVALEVAAKASGIASSTLRERAEAAEVRRRVEASTEEFHSLKITQRPAFVLEDAIGDRAVFSGLVRVEPLVATIEAMLSDTAGYAAHTAHFGNVPPT